MQPSTRPPSSGPPGGGPPGGMDMIAALLGGGGPGGAGGAPGGPPGAGPFGPGSNMDSFLRRMGGPSASGRVNTNELP